MFRIAIVAALERELRPLIKHWSVSEKEYAGRRFRFFENQNVVMVCGGIGAEAARRAAEAVIATYKPAVIYSAGFAGALDPSFKVGRVVEPQRVLDASDGSSVSLENGEGLLVSVASVASPEKKLKLRQSYGAGMVDMEAAAVARAAEARGVRFAVVKVISDEFDFTFPSMDAFVDSDGKFSEGRFARFAAVRPWLWLKVARMARDSRSASQALCRWLQQKISSSFRESVRDSSEASGLEALNPR
jgi:adenosylhomocysteine nucleosidase